MILMIIIILFFRYLSANTSHLIFHAELIYGKTPSINRVNNWHIRTNNRKKNIAKQQRKLFLFPPHPIPTPENFLADLHLSTEARLDSNFLCQMFFSSLLSNKHYLLSGRGSNTHSTAKINNSIWISPPTTNHRRRSSRLWRLASVLADNLSVIVVKERKCCLLRREAKWR